MTVWRVPLDRDPSPGEDPLSADERERIGRLRVPAARRRVRRSRVALRHLLALETGVPAAAIRFRHGPAGRPELEEPAGGVRFNLSRSGELALVAVARGRGVGVDVERLLPIDDLHGTAAIVLAEGERRRLATVAGDRALEVFLEYWTLKEARLKADGRGLTADPRTIVVPPVGAGAARAWAGGAWVGRTIAPAPGYVGAVVAEGGGWELVLRDYDRPVPSA